MKWQRVLPLQLWLKTARPVTVPFRCAPYFIYQSSSFFFKIQSVLIYNNSSGCFVPLYHLPPSFPECLFLDKVQNQDVVFTLPNIIYCILCLSLCYFSSLTFLYLLSALCHVSILCIYRCPLFPTSLCLPAVTPFASDSVRQPLSAWLKSSGPTGRAKPWVCFPSERLLFAHSGN